MIQPSDYLVKIFKHFEAYLISKSMNLSPSFSYVKRQLTIRKKNNVSTLELEDEFRPETLADMSKYYIEPTPALKSMIEIIKKFFADGTSKDEPLDLLVSLSKICTKILDCEFKGKYQRWRTVGMLCR